MQAQGSTRINKILSRIIIWLFSHFLYVVDCDEDKFFSGILIENVFTTSVYFKSVSARKKNKESEAAVTKYDTTGNKIAPVQAVATPGTHREAGLLTKPNQQPIYFRPP
jgi:hypothetical protein